MKILAPPRNNPHARATVSHVGIPSSQVRRWGGKWKKHPVVGGGSPDVPRQDRHSLAVGRIPFDKGRDGTKGFLALLGCTYLSSASSAGCQARAVRGSRLLLSRFYGVNFVFQSKQIGIC
ncbi:Hypothetical protein NTJ_05221 [Nesidiocoris tenuis]|uniref:Homeobox domain-containing protein n=1 Tax=Nesidiocoris tenuis TaxID=355587 RepID=A0ABN7AJH7_9HEMI|nr:Hypothetical protein NTJ_05221 [Nesidiocoris tenuis]